MHQIVGIDIASRKFDFHIISEEGESIRKGHFDMSRSGFESFLSAMDRDSLFVMESTGRYHLPLRGFLVSRGCSVSVANPLLVNKFVKANSLRRTKTDSADALSIARYARINYDTLTREKARMDEEVRSIARRRQEVAEDIARAKTQLKSDLAAAWPEILSLDVFTTSMIKFLSSFGSPTEVLAATDEELLSALSIKRGRGLEHSVETIKELAAGSIGVGSCADLVKDSAEKIAYLEKRDKALTEALIAHEKKVHAKEIEILTSFPGIGDVTAAHFMAEIDDISRFSSYQKLVAYIGTDPSIYQSGEHLSSGHITKHGNSSLRKYCFLMAQRSITYNPVFNDYYAKKIGEGFSYRKAMVAVMNKLIKVIYTLLTRSEKYKIQD